jgi:AcrR family transcriptional regulator
MAARVGGWAVVSSTIRSIRDESRARAREAVVDAAMDLLLQHGQDALSLRKVASAVGASTQVIATHFADKQGLLDALFARGFTALTEQTKTLPPGAGVAGCMRAYRAFALAQPPLYRLMFTRTEREYRPGPEAKEAARTALEALVEAIAPPASPSSATPETERAEVSPKARAHYVWAVAHGHVALELADFVSVPPDADALYDLAIAHVEAALA